ncbi:MAG: c-type cytochrome [Ramlibacter sp.]|uniref:c-type cytochrome n=1 Tax=Ramlibacter sp. TaxID=1917967 RepID=UPI00260BD6DF|nr:c-type cytochrome [Ramlibacter sp.]MDH4377907.1 c-type cytochrome [Ramlibacter sp.]
MIRYFRSLLGQSGLFVACATALAATLAAPAAFAQSAAPAAATGAATGAKSVETKAAMCIGCHGIPGYQATFPEIHRVPMISGQNAKYIVAALNAYKNGDRKHPTMRGIGAGMSEQDMVEVADWYAKQGKPAAADKPSREPSPQVAALLQKAACTSCHGVNFSKATDPAYPKLAGQHADYLFVALKSYKNEPNNVVGRSNGVMGGIAKQFTNAELKALAQYVGSLEGEMQVKPQSRFR